MSCAAGAAMVVAGCAQLIDLGDAPPLAEPSDDTETSEDRRIDQDASTSSHSDAGATSSSSGNSQPGALLEAVECADELTQDQSRFLQSSKARVSPACFECVTDGCCQEQLDCGSDPACVEATDCLRSCFEATCVLSCLSQTDNPTTQAFMSCNLSQCVNECLPTGDCARLGSECCGEIDEPLVKDGCLTIAQKGNANACAQGLNTFSDECPTLLDAGVR